VGRESPTLRVKKSEEADKEKVLKRQGGIKGGPVYFSGGISRRVCGLKNKPRHVLNSVPITSCGQEKRLYELLKKLHWKTAGREGRKRDGRPYLQIQLADTSREERRGIPQGPETILLKNTKPSRKT